MARAPRPTDVVVGTDLSPDTSIVVSEAAVLARALGAVLHLVHVAAGEPDLVGWDPDGGPNDRSNRAGELLAEHAEVAAMADDLEDVEVRPLVVIGPTVERLLDVARRFDHSLLVVGSHGRGLAHRLLVGSTTDALLRHTDQPVVVVPVPRRSATS